MPQYYFHVKDGSTTVEDLEGIDIPSIELARDEAIDAAREILAGKVRRGEVIDGQEFRICDAWGNNLLTVPFKSAINLK